MAYFVVSDVPDVVAQGLEGITILSPTEYLDGNALVGHRSIKILNLCQTYGYQSLGYYVSLLAEARGHRPLPVTSTMMDFKLPGLAREDAQDFDRVIQEGFQGTEGQTTLELTLCFGKTDQKTHSKIGSLLFQLYPMPIQKAVFQRKGRWQLQSLKPVPWKDLTVAEKELFHKALEGFVAGDSKPKSTYKRKQYDLAILVNPDDPNPPSDAAALAKFEKAAERVGFNTEFITKADFGRIYHFDALFIRETTNVNHHTFRFARRAEYERIPVIDDPTSILRCTNKVYLKELLDANKIPTPKSVIFQKGTAQAALQDFAFPFVLKQPDGAFSKGVKKVTDPDSLQKELKTFFQHTELLIAQEFMPTDYDWRVGVLGGRILYVCKYYMARGHWQIVDWKADANDRNGRAETLPTFMAPQALLATALKATKLIGNGLYGVDIKERKGKFYVIEVNDNPSIDAGIEDQVEKRALYEGVIQHLMDQVLTIKKK